jgi:pimeloyl-ACP methyl ester carboxylesterase
MCPRAAPVTLAVTADIAYRTADVDGFTVFYREARAPDAPVLLLLHGYQSASHQFRELIPLLAGRFRTSASSTPATSPWKPTPKKSPPPSANSSPASFFRGPPQR